jgi:hypothetical protein
VDTIIVQLPQLAIMTLNLALNYVYKSILLSWRVPAQCASSHASETGDEAAKEGVSMKMKEKEGTHERQNAGKGSLPQTRVWRGRARVRQTRKRSRFISVGS